jgi:hypothetical protein
VRNKAGLLTKSGYDRTCDALVELVEAGRVIEDLTTSRFMVINDVEEPATPEYVDPDILDARVSEELIYYPSILIGSTFTGYGPLKSGNADACGGRLLRPCEYCLSCDRWGKD